MKKLLLSVLSLALVATIAVSGTVAYFSDTEEAINVMTTGRVDITLNDLDKDNNDFAPTAIWPLIPADEQNTDPSKGTNYVVKKVSVDNKTISSAAYVRVLLGVPKTLEAAGALNLTMDTTNWTKVIGTYPEFVDNGVTYVVYAYNYNDKLGVNEKTTELLSGLWLDPQVNWNDNDTDILTDDFYSIGNTKIAEFNGTVYLPVFAQAVQVEGFENANAAFTAAGYNDAEGNYISPWENLGVRADKDWNTTPAADNAIYINTKEELAAFAAAVNGGNTFAGKTVKLNADLNLANMSWTPIGNSSTNFKGTFDGQNHTISNLLVDGGESSNIGLFGATSDGEVKNLNVHNAKVSGRLNVGVVSGSPYTSKFTNIKVTGHVEVDGMAYVGGVLGKNVYANVTNITVDVDESSFVRADSIENGTMYRTYVGGVIGFMGEGGHTVKNVKSNIDVIGNGVDVGGITGIAHYNNNFVNVSSSGDVTLQNTGNDDNDRLEVGGIAGVWHNENGTKVTFKDCSFTGNVTSTGLTAAELLAKNPNYEIVGTQYSATGTGELVITNATTFVGSAADLKTALENGTGDITLSANIENYDADNTFAIPASGNLTLNLAGYTLTAQSDKTGTNCNLFDVDDNATLTVENGTILYKHTGANMGWTSSTNLFNVDGGGVLNLTNVTAENQGGSDMGFVVHLNNWGEVTLNAENCILKSTYVPVRVFNSGFDKNNVTIKNTRLEGKSAAFWVHNYLEDGLQSTNPNHTDAAIKARLNFKIYNNGNTFVYDGGRLGPIRYGMTNSIYFDAKGTQVVPVEP